jgi:hypothetical protein
VVSVVLPRQPSTEFMPPAFAERPFTPDKASSNVRVALQLFRHVSMKDALKGHPEPFLNMPNMPPRRFE